MHSEWIFCTYVDVVAGREKNDAHQLQQQQEQQKMNNCECTHGERKTKTRNISTSLFLCCCCACAMMNAVWFGLACPSYGPMNFNSGWLVGFFAAAYLILAWRYLRCCVLWGFRKLSYEWSIEWNPQLKCEKQCSISRSTKKRVVFTDVSGCRSTCVCLWLMARTHKWKVCSACADRCEFSQMDENFCCWTSTRFFFLFFCFCRENTIVVGLVLEWVIDVALL